MTDAPQKPLPVITESTAPFWEGTRRSEFLLQRCLSCDEPRFPPKPVCSHCWSTEHRWVPAAGTGSVYSYTVVHRAGMPAFREDVPYVIAVIDLDEGVRVMSNLVGCDPEDVSVGMAVRVLFEEASEEMTLYRFEPAG